MLMLIFRSVSWLSTQSSILRLNRILMRLLDFKNPFCDIEFILTKGDAMNKKTVSKIMLVMTLFTAPILAENDQDLSQTEPSTQDNSSSSSDSNERDSADREEKTRREEQLDAWGQGLMERGVY
jgi:hypothetical protein